VVAGKRPLSIGTQSDPQALAVRSALGLELT